MYNRPHQFIPQVSFFSNSPVYFNIPSNFSVNVGPNCMTYLSVSSFDILMCQLWYPCRDNYETLSTRVKDVRKVIIIMSFKY